MNKSSYILASGLLFSLISYSCNDSSRQESSSSIARDEPAGDNAMGPQFYDADTNLIKHDGTPVNENIGIKSESAAQDLPNAIREAIENDPVLKKEAITGVEKISEGSQIFYEITFETIQGEEKTFRFDLKGAKVGL